MGYDYLPGLQIDTLDGGLSSKRTPQAKSTVIVGTAGIGPADVVYQVNDPAVAVQDFGFGGSLIQGLQEVIQGGCDNSTFSAWGLSRRFCPAWARSTTPPGTRFPLPTWVSR